MKALSHENGETSGARIHLHLPSLMQVYERLSVGYYDLIVADKAIADLPAI